MAASVNFSVDGQWYMLPFGTHRELEGLAKLGNPNPTNRDVVNLIDSNAEKFVYGLAGAIIVLMPSDWQSWGDWSGEDDIVPTTGLTHARVEAAKLMKRRA